LIIASRTAYINPYRLDVGNTNLTSLPELPSTHEYLNCYNNEISNLPIHPQGLTHMLCSGTHISALPDILPPKLEKLDCYGCPMTELPELPSTLTDIDFYHTDILERTRGKRMKNIGLISVSWIAPKQSKMI
jgi:Leucine-rich repeat (LRR) protein